MQTPTYKQSECQLRRRNYKSLTTKQLKLCGYSKNNSNYEKSVMVSDVRAGSLVAQAQPNQLVSRYIRESIISVNRSDQNATMERSLESYPSIDYRLREKCLTAPGHRLCRQIVGLLENAAKTSTEERILHRHRGRKRAWYLHPLTYREDRIPGSFARH